MGLFFRKDDKKEGSGAGRSFAKTLKSGAPGWTVAVENNIYGGTSNWSNSSIKTMGAWYCTHLWRSF